MKNRIVIITLVLSFQLNAVHLSNDGMGQVLIFPYYTVNGGFNTLIDLTNTTDEAKALRVRFREAANSRDVFAFNLYLGPNDVWTGGLVLSDNGIPKLITNDDSCTVPSINSEFELFHKHNFQGGLVDEYGEDSNRLREGFIEVIEMGVLTGNSAVATIMMPDNAGANCDVLNNAWNPDSDDNYWLSDASIDMLKPTGGLSGSVLLIDVEDGISISENPTVLGDFSDEILHFETGNVSPSLADGNKISVVPHSSGKDISVEWQHGFEAVSAVLMATTINNEFVLSEAIGASTDWIMTMPTRQFHMDPVFSQGLQTPVVPYNEISTEGFEGCQEFNLEKLYNRESENGLDQGGIVVGSPPPPLTFGQFLCNATNNMSFIQQGDERGNNFGLFESDFRVKGSLNGLNPLSISFSDGYIGLTFETHVSHPTYENREIDVYGLPVIGFSVQKYTNANAQPGVLANYAGIFEHKNKLEVNLHSSQVTTAQGNENLAMKISADNSGQVLIYPYYTVTNGLNTLISVVNPTDEVKALSVKFLEGKNNRECLSFNVYLNAYDVWTAGLIPTQSTVAGYVGQQSVKLLTFDNSCTVPTVIDGQEFLPYNFNDAFVDGLGVDLQRCTEGHIEIYDMGQLINNDAIAAMHDDDGVPSDCAKLDNNWQPPLGQWLHDSTANIIPSNAGIFGSVSLIDIVSGIDITYDAKAISNFSSEVMHYPPFHSLPNLASGNNLTTSIKIDEGMFKTIWNSPLDAVSALFMQSEISNDFVTTDSIGAKTAWVNLYPTKQFYVDPIHTAQVPLKPFSGSLQDTGACEDYNFRAYNREQMNNLVDMSGVIVPGVSPPGFDPVPPVNCWSLNVEKVETVETDNSRTIFSSNLSNELLSITHEYHPITQLPFSEGYMSMKFDADASRLEGIGENGEIHHIFGKPVIGFVAQKYVNGSLNNGSVLANYAITNWNNGKKKIEVIQE